MVLRVCLLWCASVLLAIPFARAQGEPGPQPPAEQPAPPQTPQELLSLVDQVLETVRQLNAVGRRAEADRMLADTQRGLKNLLDGEPGNVDARVLLGELLMEARDLNAARREFKEVLAEDPSNFRANLGLGRFYVSSRLSRQAGLYLENAARVAPPDRRGEVLQLLARAYAGQGQRAEAITAAQRAAAADPDSIEPLQLLVQVYLGAEQFDQAVESANALLEVATKRRQTDLADRTRLEDLMSACQIKLQALQGYYRSLCRRDARGQFTDQLRAGTEVEAIRVLSDIAYLSEELAKLGWELGYHRTLSLLEPVVEYQTEQTRQLFENNTRYLLDLAGLFRATHQDERAVETLQRIVEITSTTDADPAEARRNQEMARELLRRANVPPATQPAAVPPQP